MFLVWQAGNQKFFPSGFLWLSELEEFFDIEDGGDAMLVLAGGMGMKMTQEPEGWLGQIEEPVMGFGFGREFLPQGGFPIHADFLSDVVIDERGGG